jgi:pimeloyl-ACP methyl ester carboxylesterase/DNA-binding CsgD family transcriptional regulator
MEGEELMVLRPETRYANNGGVHLAYQIVGSGPVDLIYVPGFINNLELQWDHLGYAQLLSRLAAFSRLILFDKRGTGLSDPVLDVPTLEQRADDVRSVMDAVGSARAIVLGASEGGAMAALFAATHPDRTSALVLYGAYPSFADFVAPPDRLEPFLAEIEAEWGSGFLLRHFARELHDDPAQRAWWARHERLGASPGMAQKLVRMNASIDIRAILPAIRVPTLIIHRRGDTRTTLEASHVLAAEIRGAHLAEIAGDAHPIWMGDVNSVADEVESFVTGTRTASVPDVDRVLATLLAAELAEPEREAAALGDRAWCERLGQYGEEAAKLLAMSGARRGASVRADGAIVAAFAGPASAVRCAAELRTMTQALLGRGLRCGLHVGEVATGRMDHAPSAGGLALHVALRIAALAQSGEVLVSGTVRDLVAGSGLRFRERESRLPLGPEAGGVRLPILALAGDDKAARNVPREVAPPSADAPAIAGAARLTPRERVVLGLMARGLSNRAIADNLAVSEHTIKRQVTNVLQKLGLAGRAAAAAYASRAGIG